MVILVQKVHLWPWEQSFNNVYENSGFGMYNEYTDPANGAYSYWGATNGPSGSGSGSGDDVNENVAYIPWSEGLIKPEINLEAQD